MGNTAFGSGTPDDVFVSDAQQAALDSAESAADAETAQAAAEQALADTLAALDAQILDDHFDVTVPAPSSGDFLVFDGAEWVNQTTVLDDLDDVSVAAPTLDDVLQFDGAAWVAQPLVALGFLPIGGGTMTGVLTLDADPVLALQAATKQYVDAALSFYDIGAFFDGVPASSDDILRFVINRECFIPGSASDSRAEARVATTLEYIALLRRNGINIGTITWAALATDATIVITSASNENFVAGDTLEVIGAAVADASINDITVTLALTLGVG